MTRWLLLIALGACPPKPTPMFDAPPPVDAGWCLAPAVTATANVCVDMFTADGRVCAHCENVAGCVDHATGVYCAAPSCVTDPKCALETERQPVRPFR